MQNESPNLHKAYTSNPVAPIYAPNNGKFDHLPNQRNRFFYDQMPQSASNSSWLHSESATPQQDDYYNVAAAANLAHLYHPNGRWGNKVPFLGFFFDRDTLRNEFERFLLLKLDDSRQADLGNSFVKKDEGLLQAHARATRHAYDEAGKRITAEHSMPPKKSYQGDSIPLSPSHQQRNQRPQKIPYDNELKQQETNEHSNEVNKLENKLQNKKFFDDFGYKEKTQTRGRGRGTFRGERGRGRGMFRGERGRRRGRRGDWRGRRDPDENNFYTERKEAVPVEKSASEVSEEKSEENTWGAKNDDGVTFGDDASDGEQQKEQKIEFE